MTNTKNVLRFIIIPQYIPRLYLIFPLTTQIVEATGVVTETAWAGAAYNLIFTRNPVAYITHPSTQLDTKSAPFMAAFSSKGPNTITPQILKPDITAPSVSIIVA